jgi:hypothetical protein
MKIKTILLAASIAVVWSAPAPAQNQTFTGANGQFQGSSVTRGNTSSFYNGRGQFDGSTITHGNSTSLYDRSGRYQGSVTSQGSPSNPLGGGARR